jgi:hypothetical protein
VGEGVGVGVLVEEADNVGVFVGLGVLDGVGVGVGVAVGAGVRVGSVDLGVAVGKETEEPSFNGKIRGFSQTVTTETHPPEICLHPPQVDPSEHFFNLSELKFKIKFGR